MTIGVQQLMLQVERTVDAFHHAVYDDRDPDAALAVAAPGCALVNLPLGGGADGTEQLRRYLSDTVLPHLPADLGFHRASRTVDRWRVADEVHVSFTHDRELPWLLPGVAPTGRHAQVLALSVVSVRQSQITSHRTLWDHSGLLRRLRPDDPA